MKTVFAEGIASWRRIIEQSDDQLLAFSSAGFEVARYITKGLDPIEAADALTEIAQEFELDADEAQQILARTVNQADELTIERTDRLAAQYVNGQDYQQQQHRRLIQTDAEFIAAFQQPDWLLDGILQRGFLYSFTGRTGSGKTAVVMLIAAHVALGRNLGDLEVTRGRVLYFAGENPDDVRNRYIAMSQQLDFEPPIGVHFIPGVFKISQMRERILAEMQAIGEFALIIIDTSAAYFEGEEVNSNTQQGRHARMMRTLIDLPGRPCVLAACHPVKNAADNNLTPLGAGAFLNEVDGNLTCSVEFPSVEVHWQGKIRGPDFEPLSFELKTVPHERLKDSKGRQMFTVVAKHLSDTAIEEMAKAVAANEDRLLLELNRNPRASIAELAQRLDWLLSNGKPHKSKVSRALNKLKKQKLVLPNRRGGYELTPKGKHELGVDDED